MENKEYLEDLKEIKNLMSRSQKFISLSGTSSILAGSYAIIGALIAYFFIFPKNGGVLIIGSYKFYAIIVTLLAIALLSLITAIVLSAKKAPKNKERLKDKATQRLLINFLIPMVAGGIYIIIKLTQHQAGLSGALMLLFYGLALLNASHYTISKVRYLGIAQIITGLICAAFPGYGIWFWVFGFGILHIVYGIYMLLSEKK